MTNAPQDPYRPFGEPDEPTWGSAAGGGEPPPTYPQYAPPPTPGAYPQLHDGQQGYPPAPHGYGAPAEYGVAPYMGQYSDKNKTTAGLLQLLLPFVFVCGVGRLYSGHTTIGVLQLVLYFVGFLFFPLALGIWLWSVIDGIVMLASSQYRDGQGRLLRS